MKPMNEKHTMHASKNLEIYKDLTMLTKILAKNAFESVKETALVVDRKYETYVREKAIELLNQKLSEKGLKVDAISKDDYEAMVCDHVKDIKKSHSKKLSQGLFTFIGIDFLMGW